MANATVTKDEIVGLIKGVEDKVDKALTPIQGLLKMAQEPASRAGVKPEEWLTAQVQKSGSALFDPRGVVLGRSGYKKKHWLGTAERADGKRGSFGEYLSNFRNFHDTAKLTPDERMAAHTVLKSYGQQQWKYQTMGNDEMVIKTALAESSAIAGGYTLPPQFESQLYEIALEGAIVGKRAKKQPLTTRTAIIPALDQTNTSFTAVSGQSNLLAGLVASWTAEAATRKESEPLFRNIVGTAWELSFYALASNTLLADNAVGLDALLTQLFAMAIDWYTEYAYFQGTGVGQPLGMLNSGCVIKVTGQGGANSGKLYYNDLTNMIGHIYWPTRNEKLCWVVHPTGIPLILQLNDNSAGSNQGRLVFQPYNQGAQEAVPESDGPQSIGRLLGYPCLVSEKVPACVPGSSSSDGWLGLYDMSQYCLFERMDIEIMVSPHVQFLQNQQAWRIVWRGDGQPLLNKAITYADGAATSTASPFVLLH